MLVEVGNTLAFCGGFGCAFVDIAPEYVSTYDGVASTFLGLSGVIMPVVTALLTPTVRAMTVMLSSGWF